MTEAKIQDERWASFRAAGLFRDGVHHDTQVTAITPDGSQINLAVKPVHVNDGQDTLFVAHPNEAGKMTKVFPKKVTSCI